MQNLPELKKEILTHGYKLIWESLGVLEDSVCILDYYKQQCSNIEFMMEHEIKTQDFMRKTYRRLKGEGHEKDDFTKFREFTTKLSSLDHYKKIETAGTFYIGDEKYLLEELVRGICVHVSSLENPGYDENEEFHLRCLKNFISHIEPHLTNFYDQYEACLSYITGETNPFIPKIGFFSSLELQLKFARSLNN